MKKITVTALFHYSRLIQINRDLQRKMRKYNVKTTRKSPCCLFSYMYICWQLYGTTWFSNGKAVICYHSSVSNSHLHKNSIFITIHLLTANSFPTRQKKRRNQQDIIFPLSLFTYTPLRQWQDNTKPIYERIS